MTTPGRSAGNDEHGNVFGRGWGNMFIHVQRESGLAHRTLVLRPWQVQALRLVVSRWFAAVVAVALLSWAYFALQTARVPFLTRRIAHLEEDAAKIDTLQATLDQLQRRYTQVQQMLSASSRSAPAAAAASSRSAPAPAAAAAPPTPITTTTKPPAATPPKKPATASDSSAMPGKTAPTLNTKRPAPASQAPRSAPPAAY